MTVATRKFNPGFLSEEELVASFCVRTHEFESIVETLRGCTGNSNQHQIVIGPRGSGKTTLLLRVAAEIARDAELSERLFPIRFAEESYEVSTAGEFWLECLSQLSNQAPSGQGGPDLRRTCGDLRTSQDDQALSDRCLGTLLDYSDRHGKRLVLLVENLNMMFRDMVDPNAGWTLRHTLQTEPRIILLASATSRFAEMDDPDNALYDLLQAHSLEPLDTRACRVLWNQITGESPSEEKVRPLEILTGGSPRFMAVLARFGTVHSLGNLIDQLLDLIDEHTEYFKSHIEYLPPQERRVYLALADLWEPATTKEVAARARTDTNKCSALLKRLTDRGAVRVVGGTQRRKEYYLAERLYNIYYLLRRHRGPEPMILALLNFMARYYSSSDLLAVVRKFVDDTSALDGPNPLKLQLLERLPQLVDSTATSKAPQKHRDLLRLYPLLGQLRLADRRDPGDALRMCDRLLAASESKEQTMPRFLISLILVSKTEYCLKLGRPKEAISTADEALAQLGTDTDAEAICVAWALSNKSAALREVGRSEDALTSYEELDRRLHEHRHPAVRAKVASTLVERASVLADLNRGNEALSSLVAVTDRYSTCEDPRVEVLVAVSLVDRGLLLCDLDRPEEALTEFALAVERFDELTLPAPGNPAVLALVMKAEVLRALGRGQEARRILHGAQQRLQATTSNASSEELVPHVALELAALELDSRNYATAVQLTRSVLGLSSIDASDRCRALFLRGHATLREDSVASKQDYKTALETLPSLDEIPPETIGSLIAAAAELGSDPVLALINASSSADVVLPLKTALEMDLGRTPRVALEVGEVAKDIGKDLVALRQERACPREELTAKKSESP